MEAGAGLLLMLLGVCSGVETSCDGRQNGAQCYGALGGTVDIQLVDNNPEIFKFQWKKDRNILLSLNNKMIITNKLENRSLFTPNNGTFRINNLSRTDSGEYKLKIFNSDGKKTGHRTLQLFVQAPVSSVQLVFQCLSQGQMNVSCSSEGGDSPQYSWTLDGHTLTDSELLSGTDETNVIVLRQIVSGRLICSVRNHISILSKELLWSQPVASDCGFIFINCSSNGTHISEWVFEANNTLCVEPTITPTTGPHSTVGVEMSCDGKENGAQCYGALGGTVDIQLMDNASEIFKFQWKKDGNILLSLNNKMIITNKLERKSLFIFSKGTFRINNLSRTDSGEYELNIFNSDGANTENRTLQLFVQAPVSSVQLVSQCLSQGQMNVSCSSEGGDSPQYSWTLDGHTLTDSELLSGTNETNIIVLRQTVSGRLICSVRNHISILSKELLWNQPVASDCGFIFINCSSNGTHISEWVFKANNTLCVEPTITPTTGPHSTVGVETSCDGRQNGAQCYGALGGTVDIQLVDNASEIFRLEGPRLLVCSLLFVVTFLSCGGIALYFKWKETKYKKEPSAPRRKEPLEDFTETELKSLSDD